MLSDAKPPQSRHGLPCSVGALLAALKGKELAALQSMLTSSTWKSSAIWEACHEEGYQIGRQTVSRHRAKACRCGDA